MVRQAAHLRAGGELLTVVQGDVYEYRFKVIVVGDSGAGKTSTPPLALPLCRRYTLPP